MSIKNLFTSENMSNAASTMKDGAKQHAPTLMLIGATIGFGLTIYEAIKAKPKADDILKEAKEKIEAINEPVEDDEDSEEKTELTDEAKKDEIRKIKIDAGLKLAKIAAKPLATAGTTLGLMWGANYISMKRISTLSKKLADATALYDISQEALKKYRKAVGEEVGEEKKTEIEKKIIDEEKQNEGTDPRYVLQWFLDQPTGRVFPSTLAQIENGVADVRLYFNSGEFIDANTLYDNWGIDDCGFGEDHGWDPAAIDLWVKMNETKKLPDGRTVTVLEYDTMERPRYE